jgi:hypothetical protein
MAAEEGVIGFLIWSAFKGGFGEEHVTTRGATPEFMDEQTSFP